MSDIVKRLKASINCDAINGDRDERSICQSQMYEAANHITTLEQRIAELEAALDKLARLGNEPHYGNSIGNQIAIAALKPTAQGEQG